MVVSLSSPYKAYFYGKAPSFLVQQMWQALTCGHWNATDHCIAFTHWTVWDERGGGSLSNKHSLDFAAFGGLAQLLVPNNGVRSSILCQLCCKLWWLDTLESWCKAHPYKSGRYIAFMLFVMCVNDGINMLVIIAYILMTDLENWLFFFSKQAITWEFKNWLFNQIRLFQGPNRAHSQVHCWVSLDRILALFGLRNNLLWLNRKMDNWGM